MDNREDEYAILQQMITDGSHEENASVDTDQYLNLEHEDIGVAENANEDTDAPNGPSASGLKKKSTRRGPTSWKNFEGRFVIDEVAEDGQPIGPANAATKFVNYRGYLVRDHVPISLWTWRPTCKDDPHAVPKIQKEMLWDHVKQKFNIPQEHLKKVEDWTLKKMADLFWGHKKKLYDAFQKHGKVPNFNPFPKHRGHWEEFINYKQSEEAIEISAKAKETTYGWTDRLKHWFYAHHGTLAEDGNLVYRGDKSKEATERLIEAIKKTRRGEFIPDREKDELTLILENLEHPRRTRGYGSLPRKYGFVADAVIWKPTKRQGHTRGKVMNLTTRLAYGMASPPLPNQRLHGEVIPEGYLDVSVDEVCEGYGDLELPIPVGDGGKRLSEALHGFILWKKTINRGGAPSPLGSPLGSPSPAKKSPLPPKKIPSPPRRSPSPTPRRSPSPPPPPSSKNVPPKKGLSEEKSSEKTPIDPSMQAFFVNMSKGAKRQILSDYDRTIQKSSVEKRRKPNEEPPQPQATRDPHYLIVVHVQDQDYFNGIEIFYLDFKDIYEIYHRGTLNISLVSCWVLMEIQRCRTEGIYDVGFMDPVVINQKTINDHREDVRQRVIKFFINQHFKTFVLLPYHWGAWRELRKSQPGLR
ncbi:hypothetical protein BS78_05G241900 [Paspalum vaginatum]|nr:hypothetical protein BS78_05G241900 [Paspalum vaginatum]